jgi:hypothetical protein
LKGPEWDDCRTADSVIPRLTQPLYHHLDAGSLTVSQLLSTWLD